MTDTASVRSCWMCGAPADSREHKFKKSDLVRRYGAQPFKNVGGVFHSTPLREIKNVPGPSAKTLTYEPVICSHCNNVVSQPLDKAYQKFEQWLFENVDVVFQRRFILLNDVFDSDIENGGIYLYKYFSKIFGCRLADSGEQVPKDIIELLPRDYFETRLRLTFAVNKSLLAMSYNEEYLGLGDLVRIDSKHGRMERYIWHIQIGWLRVSFFYDEIVPPGLGAPWVCDIDCLYLGEVEPIPINDLIDIVGTINGYELAGKLIS